MYVSEITASNVVGSIYEAVVCRVVTDGHRIGYVRVSTLALTVDQQRDALDEAEVAKTFSDFMCGARDDRPGLADFNGLLPRGRHGGGLEARQAGQESAAHLGDREGPQ
jgi:hypothetical protein